MATRLPPYSFVFAFHGKKLHEQKAWASTTGMSIIAGLISHALFATRHSDCPLWLKSLMDQRFRDRFVDSRAVQVFGHDSSFGIDL